MTFQHITPTVMDDVLVIELARRMIREDGLIEKINREVRTCIAQAPKPHVVIDCEQVAVFSSALLNLFVRLERTKEFRLCCLNEPLRDAFSNTHLDQMFDIYPTLKEALAAIAAESKQIEQNEQES